MKTVAMLLLATTIFYCVPRDTGYFCVDPSKAGYSLEKISGIDVKCYVTDSGYTCSPFDNGAILLKSEAVPWNNICSGDECFIQLESGPHILWR